MMTSIQTLGGPHPARSIAVADAHAHLWLQSEVDGNPVLHDEELALAELADFASVGGSLVVDCQPGGAGRDERVLMRLAQASTVAIVAATGFHLPRYYPPGKGVWSLSEQEAFDFFARELASGMDLTPGVRAGVVKCAWTGKSSHEMGLMQAALTAARQLDAGVVVHTEAGARVEQLIRVIEACGVSPGRVQISHIDKRPEYSLHRDLARAGYVLGYDTFLRPKYDPERRVWPMLLRMVQEGLWTQITLGLDLVDSSQWYVRGGPGLRTIAKQLLPRLHQAGVSDTALQALGGGNIARLLARRHGRDRHHEEAPE
ncbi:hypothetical protein [Thermogemmatispora carboxidivorans]|uniref:phosphotriesterase family protein n=1 Tax=Thermogemmatispora carboxidivorans TaxID=1382306 RepID=UPI00069B85E4|nr:hypothetical protein [Thermogemmatispora carboxidivorans]